MILNQILVTFEHFARGGGGGSGGGGGGGGGGGSGGGGGGIIFLLGYLPAHFVGAWLRRKLHNPLGLAIMAIFTLVYGTLWWVIGSVGVIISLAAYIGGPAGYFDWFGKVSFRLKKKVRKELLTAAASDPAWDEAALNARVSEIFYKFQNDWSTFNLASLKSYLSESYSGHIGLMLAAIKQRGRQNLVESPVLMEFYPTQVDNLPDNNQDSVTYLIHATANDKLIEQVDGQAKQLFVDKSNFYEYWHFYRGGNNWYLGGISQLTENKFLFKPEISVFAINNGMYYSPDWGWLLLPSRGQLFKGGKFGISDVNNHVIGVYRNLLVELYTYIPNPKQSDTAKSGYTIAQVGLPKRYDSLVVEAKTGIFNNIFRKTPKGYNKMTLEWPEFNKRYNVFATNVEQVTAFELLHPVYMEKLFALPFKVSIEVVDNVVYLHSQDKKADYETMFSILKDAFAEMRL